MTTPFAPLTIIEAPQGALATDIGAFATSDLSTTVMTLRPSAGDAAAVASDILRALGKRSDVNGKARHGIEDKVLTPVWLTAHRVENLIIASPQSIHDDQLLHIIDLCGPSPTNVVVACDPDTSSHFQRALQGHLPQLQPWPALPAQPAPEPATQTPTWYPGEPIRLPQCEFLTFYATAERTLPPELFAQVSTRYIDALDRTLTWLDDVHDTYDGLVPITDINAAMRELLDEQQTLDQVATVLHAAEAAFFRSGWQLKWDRRLLRSNLIRLPSPHVPADTWTRLRAYRDPARASTVTLYLTGLTIDQIESLTTGQVAAWHRDPTRPLVGHHIPEAAAPLLRAQLLTCATIGHASSEQFLPISRRRALLDVRQASPDLDLMIGDGTLDRGTSHGQRRIPDTTFTVEKIA